jgi:hypothetical protein
MWHPVGCAGAAVAPADPGACPIAAEVRSRAAGLRAAAMNFPELGRRSGLIGLLRWCERGPTSGTLP